MDWLQAVYVFVAMSAVDWAWARYSMALADRRALAGSIWAVVILIPSATVVMSYVHDPAMLIPAGLGAFVGTYLSVHGKEK